MSHGYRTPDILLQEETMKTSEIEMFIPQI